MDLLFKLCGRDNGCNSQQLDRKGTTEYCLRNLLIILSSTYICSRYSRVSFFPSYCFILLLWSFSFDCSFVVAVATLQLLLLLLLLLLSLATLYTCHSCFVFNNLIFFYAYFKNPTCFCFPYLHKFWCMFYDFVQFFLLLNYKIQNSRTKQYILAIFFRECANNANA